MPQQHVPVLLDIAVVYINVGGRWSHYAACSLSGDNCLRDFNIAAAAIPCAVTHPLTDCDCRGLLTSSSVGVTARDALSGRRSSCRRRRPEVLQLPDTQQYLLHVLHPSRTPAWRVSHLCRTCIPSINDGTPVAYSPQNGTLKEQNSARRVADSLHSSVSSESIVTEVGPRL